MIKRIAVVLVIFALLSFVGCSKAPEEEMQKANTAIEYATTAEADEYAPDAYQIARDTLDAANAAKTEADGKFALFRSYGKSKELFARAEALAKEAEAAAQAGKERVRVEVTNLITQAKAVLDSADAALKKAPKGKGSKADIELMKNDLAAATAAHEEAKADFDAGKYAVAKTKLEAAIQKARRVSEEIKKAVAKKMGR
jgi:uncharacterized protein with von Willebrand factor type A (vWA) domain